MLISKFIGFVLIHLLNLDVPSAFPFKTFNWLQVTFNWYMQGKQSNPGGMQGSKILSIGIIVNSLLF